MRTLTPLMKAASMGNLPEVQRLVDEKPDEINQQSEMDWTALMLAAAGGHTDVISWLADQGADLFIKGRYFDPNQRNKLTASEIARKMGKLKAAELLESFEIASTSLKSLGSESHGSESIERSSIELTPIELGSIEEEMEQKPAPDTHKRKEITTLTVSCTQFGRTTKRKVTAHPIEENPAPATQKPKKITTLTVSCTQFGRTTKRKVTAHPADRPHRSSHQPPAKRPR